ncbi:MAG: 2-dehydro-3-deoxygluconokinase [Glaciecola sp.]|jgi:2-dehydro-3-deoxygluconokinase
MVFKNKKLASAQESNPTGSLVFAGECMLELVNKDPDTIRKSFAGDLYNSSVYLKRAFPQQDVQFMSCIGQDSLSDQLLERLASESVGTNCLASIDTHHLGAYMVVTDEHGERSFIYWRSDSAAKRMVTALSDEQKQQLKQARLFFFSGISIAILLQEEREAFWLLLEELQSGGVSIAFDPNYRPQLWENVDTAKANIEKAFQIADWLLPGVDDFDKLYGMSDVEECIQFCLQFKPSELVMKQGEQTVHIITESGRESIPVVANDNVVDTTSAGDAFNGVYLGARASGKDIRSSALAASSAASKVIETPGAIMPKDLFDQFWNDYKKRL